MCAEFSAGWIGYCRGDSKNRFRLTMACEIPQSTYVDHKCTLPSLGKRSPPKYKCAISDASETFDDFLSGPLPQKNFRRLA